MSSTPEIVVQHDAPTQLARLDPQALLLHAVERGAGIETLERLVKLATDVKAMHAREAYNAAMAEFQKRCPPIRKTKTAEVRTRSGGSYAYTFAPLDEILAVVDPIMGELGLSKSWRSRFEADRVVVVCRISHALGHYEESGDVPMPVERSDGTGANSMQRIGIALSYARRYALLSIIGKAPQDDDSDAQPPLEERDVAVRADTTTGRVEDAGDVVDGEQLIDDARATKLRAIASNHKWTQEQLYELLSSRLIMSGSIKDIPLKDYDAIVQRLKEGPSR